MAHKKFELNENQTVTIYKRRSSRNLRLTVAPDGQIRVSIPAWAPYRAGLEFAKKRQDWISSQVRPRQDLMNGQAIGKAHRLRFIAADITVCRARIKSSEIVITHPSSLSSDSQEVQEIARKACVRALRQQAHLLLPQRLATLAERYGFQYKSVIIKQLRSRWGSCDSHANIVLNLYLMQLPWESIDYVLLHELTHTKILHHGPLFWGAMEEVIPNVKQRRKAMLDFQPVLDSPLDPGL